MLASHFNGPPTHTLSINPADLGQLGVTLFLSNRNPPDPNHISYGLLYGCSYARQEKLKFRHLFVPAVPKLRNNFAEIGIRAAQWTNDRRNTEYC